MDEVTVPVRMRSRYQAARMMESNMMKGFLDVQRSFSRGVAALLVLAGPVIGFAQKTEQSAKISHMVEQLRQVHRFSQVSISPDGKWVTWTQPASGESKGVNLYLLDRTKPGMKPEQIPVNGANSPSRESGVAWAPDSSRFAFFSDAESAEQEQIYVEPIGGGKPQQISHLKGQVEGLQWSPDAKQLAFLYIENATGAGPLDAVPAQTGVIGSDIHNQRIAVMDAGGGAIHQESPAHLNVYEYDWSPDGKRFAAIAAPGPADNNWWTAQLYLMGGDSGKTSVLYHPPVDRQLAIPRWSPDGKQVAFIGGLMSDAGFVGGDIFVIDSAGGTARDVTENRKASPSWLQWLGNDKLQLTEAVEGGAAIAELDVKSGQGKTIWKGGEGLHDGGNYPNFAVSADGQTSAAIRSSWEMPPEVWGGQTGQWQQLTHANDGQQRRWGKAESMTWNNEGFHVQGWLLYPENYDSAKRYPMVVSIHGGPAGEHSPSWPSAHFDMSVMSGLGYFVFFPNPRGSYGEGEAFTHANVKDFGGGDLRDVLAGVDTVVKKLPVDNDRIGVTGWSYGGFMTMWTVTQTHRFRAAVAGAGIADWKSYYGENSIDQWMIPYFGNSVYNDPAVYAKSAPINFIKQVKTPTLVVVGERDGECPAPQSFEFWHALKTLDVPTQLVVYAGEGHAFRKPKDQVDVLQRALAWFDQYLGQSGGDAAKQTGE